MRTLSALGNWCPVFAADNVDFLPQMVFPFIKVIPNDDLLVFEIVLALILQYQQVWYEGYPGEPVVVLGAVEQILEFEDPKLVAHLRENAFTPQVYAWPLLKTLFTDVLPRDDWLRLMDHLFTYREDPELLLFFCAAFILTNRTMLTQQVHTVDDMLVFQARTSGVAFKKIMTIAQKLHAVYKERVFCGTVQTGVLPMS